MRTLRLEPAFDLSDEIDGGELVAFNVGPDGTAYFVIAMEPLDYYEHRPSGVSFPKTIPAQPQRYRVIGVFRDGIVLDVEIANEKFNIHEVQPLPERRLLLVCARSSYWVPDDFDRNGRIYSHEGRLDREILLGDGIQDVQTTAEGVIWTSYFDEGVFGNYGWNEPVGAPGLVAWDDRGRKLYEFTPAQGLDAIFDCYAMNVVSESDVWIDYYTEFPLVHIHKQKVHSIWTPPVTGADGLAISDDWVLFRGGYNCQDTYSLVKLQSDGESELIAKIEFEGGGSPRLEASRIVGRGSAFHLICGTQVYRIDVARVVESACE